MIQDLTPKEFRDCLVDDEVTLVDVREQWEFDICQINVDRSESTQTHICIQSFTDVSVQNIFECIYVMQ